MVSLAQSQSLSRVISWNKPSAFTIDDSVFENISFEGAFYSGIKALPNWNETIFMDTVSDSVLIDNAYLYPFQQRNRF